MISFITRSLRQFLIVLILSVSIIIIGCADRKAADVTVESLKCEYLDNPLGIDILQPRLSWKMSSNTQGQKQTAYQIIVAGSSEKLLQGDGDLWDSGKIISDRSVNIPYNGSSLESGMECWWRARVWDMNGDPAPWSEPSKWSMGLLNPDDWQAEWIGADWKGDPYPAFPWIRVPSL